MTRCGPALLRCAALLSVPALCAPAWSAPPAGAELRDATVAIGYDAKGRCPDLMQVDAQDTSAALVLLVVGPSGVPSQASIKSSSGSESLDAAAIKCVMKLRFLPAVQAGEGAAMASWQEIAWKWGRGHVAPGAPAAATASVPTAATSAPAAAAATATAALAAGSTVTAPAAAPHSAPGSAEVRVCADESGTLIQDPAITRSSGDPGLDAAALRIARAGAPYYRPAGSASVTGCAQLAIRFETK